MKRYQVFILLLVISVPIKGLACWFYPYGEDIRFSIFNPDNFNYNSFRIYNYTSTWFYEEDYVTNLNSVTENDLMWYNHCQKRVPITEIKKAVFEIDLSEVAPNSKNQFIRYLYAHKDTETINYLLFAKALEKLNPREDDVWEKNDDVINALRNKQITEALQRIKGTKDVMIKKRYYYQVFKLLSFSGQGQRITELYETYTKQFNTKDFLDNWALFYRMEAEQDDVKMNYLAAQVFARGTDNKFDIKWYFNRNIPIQKVLRFAKNNEEKANIYVLYSFKRIDQNLDNLIKIQQCDAKNRGLSFLLLREINKLEDWILTPTYTMYLPSLREDYWENSNNQRILNRVEVDRQYAAQLLDFVTKTAINTVDDKDFWRLSKAYLEFLTKDYSKSLKSIQSFENQIKDEKVKRQCEMIKALALTANQERGKAVIPKPIEDLLVKEAALKNYTFLFGIAKELEILEDKVDAACLISKIAPDEYENGSVFWKSRSGKITLHDDFYYDWYGYTDAELSTADMQQLIDVMTSAELSEFDRWKTLELVKEHNKVNDLMGIKYMRDDNLIRAYRYFSKVDKDHYTNGPLFNENPFYKIKGYMNFDTKKSAQGLTKAKVVYTLLQLIKKADNGKNKHRNKDYILIGNCYYNMSYYGNSWMMKRINWSAGRDANYADESEYYCCHKAKAYYEKALVYSKSKELKALCAYMISKCKARENEYLLYKQYDNYYYVRDEQRDAVIEKAFAEFKTKYPDYIELASNCEIFSEYFKFKN